MSYKYVCKAEGYKKQVIWAAGRLQAADTYYGNIIGENELQSNFPNVEVHRPSINKSWSYKLNSLYVNPERTKPDHELRKKVTQ